MRRILHTILTTAGIYASLFLLLFFSKEVSDGVKSGISVCVSLVIPSTFLFLVLTDLLSESRAGILLSRPFFFLAKLFKIDPRHVDIAVLSLIGGYPAGARMLSTRVQTGALNPADASRMLAICVNPSPAFLYTGLGVMLFHSPAVGGIFLISALLAFLLTGTLSGIGSHHSSPHEHPVSKKSPIKSTILFVDAVEKAVHSMAIICGCVLLFSACMPILRLFLVKFFPENVVSFLCGLLEVCSGSATIFTGEFSNPAAAAMLFCSFGGICVFLQIAAMLKGSGISMRRMLFWRTFYTAAATGCTAFFTRFLPQETTSAFAAFQDTQLIFASVSPAAVFSLFILAILLLFFSSRPATIRLGRKTGGESR